MNSYNSKVANPSGISKKDFFEVRYIEYGFAGTLRGWSVSRNIRRFLAACILTGMIAVPVCTQAAEVLIGVPGTEETSQANSGNNSGSAGSSTNTGNSQVTADAGSSALATDTGSSGLTPEQEKQADEDEKWSLILVNSTHPIPDDYKIPELTRLAGDNAVDSRIYPHLQQMFDDARAQGIYPAITSSYRTMEKQQELMDSKIAEYEASGYSHEDAVKQAEEWVAIPGTSEHQLGLSVDISVDETTGQNAGSVWYWLKLYCWQYGFVQRYPEDKTDITGIINEPWHYRYVGLRAAKAMTEQNLCLEEYLGVVR